MCRNLEKKKGRGAVMTTQHPINGKKRLLVVVVIVELSIIVFESRRRKGGRKMEFGGGVKVAAHKCN